MPEKQSKPINDGLDIFGTKEVLRLTIEKMQSQILIFGLALIVVLVASWRFIGSGGTLLMGSVLLVFGATLGAHLFLTTRREISANDLSSHLQAQAVAAGSELGETTQILHQMVNEKASLDLRLWVSNLGNEASYQIGDCIQVHLQASQNCYLTLLNVSSDGALTVVYPNALHKDNFLPAGQSITIPGPQDGFDYRLEGPPGTEQLKAIATREPKVILPDDLTEEGTIFRTAEPVPGARAIAVVAKEIKSLSHKHWDEASVAFKVEE